MKKFFAFILAVLMLLSIAACTPADTDSTNNTTGSNDTTAATDGDITGQLMVGYGKVDVTPTDSVPLRGYGFTERRMSNGLKSYIYLIAIAVTDTNGNTAILISADNCSTPDDVYKAASAGIAKACGIPAENVIISAIHQHSCPDLANNKVASAVRYKENLYIPSLIEVAKQAMDNRAPATVQTAVIETNNMNFVRRYRTTEGKYHGSEDYTGKYVDQETDVDNDLQLVKFVREGQTTLDGKEAKNIIVANYQGHPLMGTSSSDTNIHSDMPGAFRDELEAKLDCQSIYFSGASGNAGFISRFAEENKTNKNFREHGKALAKLVIDADDSFKDVSSSDVKATKVTFTGICDHSRDHEIAKARDVYNHWSANADKNYVKQAGYASWLEASAIITKAGLGKSVDFDIFAISFGDVAFIGAPYEMFDTTGMEIKEASPFEMTIVTTCANGCNGYIPSKLGYEHGCYETFSSKFMPGTGELLRDEYLTMLNSLHG